MGRGGKLLISNRNKKRRVFVKEQGSDDSDEDYVLDEDQESNASEGFCASADNASEESFGLVDVSSDDEEEEVEEKKRVVGSSKRSKLKIDSLEKKQSRVRQSSKRSRVSYDEEEDYELDDEEFMLDDNRRVGRSNPSKLENDSSDKKRTRVRQPSKRTRISDDEEEDYELDDEADEEFMPDGIDFMDEEEDLQVDKKKKANKVKNRISRKKVSVKSWKRKRKPKVSKKPMKKKPRRRLVVKKSESSDDDFTVSHKVVAEFSKKKTKIKTKKLGIDWDSNSDCSEPLDLEYTISEEEKELRKEANKFVGDLKPCSRNSSLSNRLHVDIAPNCQPQKPAGRKGKSKVSDLQNDSGKQVCGICLSEEGKETVQGTLNCCSHYFCFGCIMEWSKVESRCPLCKQRFVRITKPARSNMGIDLRNAVIQVPKRDQVYRPSEEEVRGYFDPYENVVCIECHQGGDDSLMLLCDICDSPAHTYCVGLGQEVPEGNWFCKGCRVTEPLSTSLDPAPDHETSNFGPPSDLSTHIISAEDIDPPPQYSVSVPEPSFSHLFENFPSPRYPILEDVHAASPSGIGASTLSGRRRVYRHMHDIRSSNRAERFSRTTEESTFQHEGTLISNGLHSAFESREQDAHSCLLEDEEFVSARFNRLKRLTQGSNTAIASTSSFSTTSCPELERTNLIAVSEQLSHCSSRPFIRSDDSICPHTFRESSCFHGGGAV